jgi:hypothetical protein
MTSYARLRDDLNLLMRQHNTVYITTMIDVFRVPNDFPGYEGASKLNNPLDRADALERAILEEFGTRTDTRFLRCHLEIDRIANGARAIRNPGAHQQWGSDRTQQTAGSVVRQGLRQSALRLFGCASHWPRAVARSLPEVRGVGDATREVGVRFSNSKSSRVFNSQIPKHFKLFRCSSDTQTRHAERNQVVILQSPTRVLQ